MIKKLDKILSAVSQPARYAGGEFGAAPVKESAALKFLMCFPDAYEVAMSNLGIKILYGLLNEREDTSCEFCFAPMRDMADAVKKEGIPLFSLSSRTPAAEFDIMGFSLSYELSYTNILYMLDLASIPFYAKDRGENYPVIIAGGACTVNPAPVSPFFDLIVVGDGEDAAAALADEFIKNKEAGGTKSDFIKRAAAIEGVLAPNTENCPKTVKRAAVKNLDAAFYPAAVPVANMEAVHNRAVLELFRGCTHGCRFCQAGFINRPVRERKPKTLLKIAKKLIENTGYEEMSLSSLSSCDYSHILELLKGLKPICDTSGVKLSLPSSRLDSFLAEYTDSSRRSSLTFAPEAGTQRLRDVINKNITEDDIISSIAAAFKKGYSSVKLYFMTGLPTETDEDIDGIVELCKKIRRVYRENAVAKKSLSLGVSVSTFVPKPFTPFQWEGQIPVSRIEEIRRRLKGALRPLNIKLSTHDAGVSKVEAALARGGERLAKVVEEVYLKGGIFDGWTEGFSFERWQNAFNKFGFTEDGLTGAIDPTATLNWDNIDIGVDKKFFLLERENAYKAAETGGCETGCKACGIKNFSESLYNSYCKNGGGK